jgi:hypothetical protein
VLDLPIVDVSELDVSELRRSELLRRELLTRVLRTSVPGSSAPAAGVNEIAAGAAGSPGMTAPPGALVEVASRGPAVADGPSIAGRTARRVAAGTPTERIVTGVACTSAPMVP